MNIRYFFLCLCLFRFLDVSAQQLKSEQPTVSRVQLGILVSYIWDEQDAYRAWTWGVNALYFVRPKFAVGVQGNLIRAGDEVLGQQNYYMAGLLTHYEFWNGPRAGFFAEAGLYKSNLCSCGEGNPYKKEGLNMLMLSGGMLFHIGRSFNQHLDLEDSAYVYTISPKSPLRLSLFVSAA